MSDMALSRGHDWRQLARLGWPVAALVLGSVTAVVATVALVLLSRPGVPAQTADSEIFWLAFDAWAVPICAILIATRRDRLAWALDKALPTAFVMFWIAFFGLAATILVNLHEPRMIPFYASPAAVSMYVCGTAVAVGAAHFLRTAAAMRRLRRQVMPARRFAWLAEIGVDRTWRLVYAAIVGVPALVFVAFLLLASGSSPLFAAWPIAAWAVIVAAGQRGSVFITETGIRVTGRVLLGAPSWSLAIGEIGWVGTGAADARMIARSMLPWADTETCVLREGPTLLVVSTLGRRYGVSLPEAPEAAALLTRLLAERSPKAP